MEKPDFFVTPSSGENFESFHFSSAVKVVNRIETSGHCGWHDGLQIPKGVEDEIAAAFRNIERALTVAGAT
jgi:enamine deaminase RidA (YjgF/YER057c/UK114 family)